MIKNRKKIDLSAGGKNSKQKFFSEERIKKIKKLIFSILLVAFLGVTLWAIFFSPLVKIQDIVINGFKEDFAKEIIYDIKNSKRWGLISQDNIFLFSSLQAKKKLQEKIILAQDINIKKVFPDKIEISFSKREGTIIWCNEGNLENCYLIDGDGEVFYQLGMSEEKAFQENFPIVFNRGDLEMAVGNVVIKPELARFCSEISDSIEKEIGLKLKNEYSTPSYMSGEIRVETEQGWDVYFNSFSTAYKQSKLLKTVLEENIKEENLSKIEYIDLRLNGKVLYKLKDSEKLDSIESDFDKEEDEEGNDLD